MQTSYTYDPYGSTSVTGTSNGNEFQYTGRESEGNGLYFYRARYYSPLLGRFISQDPLGFAGGDGNLYAYVFGDPINFFDPSGTNAALDPAAVARAARTAFEVIEGGKESGAIVAVEAAEIGGLGAADAALLAEEIQDVQTYNAENAAYDAELQAIHNLNQVLLAHRRPNGKPNGLPSLAGRYTIELPRYEDGGRDDDDCNKQWERARKFCAEVGAIPRSAPEWEYYKDIWGGNYNRCVRGQVTERCGGSRTQ
jgi:RHS repeat-associated protein